MWLTIAALGMAAASSVWNRVVQDEENRKALQNSKSRLETSIEDNTAYYGLQKLDAKNSTDRANEYLNQQTGYVEANRDNAAKVAGRVLKDQGAINAAQIAALKVDGSKAVGVGVQQAAVSGFRGTGSALNAMYDASESYRRSVATAQAQANLQRYSSYQDAVNAYTSATQQAELYKKQVEMNNAALTDKLALLDKQQEMSKKQLQYQLDDVNSDIDYMNSSSYFIAQALGIGADMFGAASDIYSLFDGNLGTKTYGANRDYTKDAVNSSQYGNRYGSRKPR